MKPNHAFYEWMSSNAIRFKVILYTWVILTSEISQMQSYYNFFGSLLTNRKLTNEIRKHIIMSKNEY